MLSHGRSEFGEALGHRSILAMHLILYQKEIDTEIKLREPYDLMRQ